jgi:hypothetical protein
MSTKMLIGELEQEAISDYIAGMSNRALEAKYGVEIGTIVKRVRRFDATKVRGKGQRTTDLSDEDKREIGRLYETGLSQYRIALALGISQPAVSLVLTGNGVKTRVGRGEHSSHWKGGRILNKDGYMRSWISSSDPMFVMADSTNYVLEHRLVMARSLGRPLGRHETIHHINGNRADNRIENLQLRNGKHGSGVVHRCRDCGSSNIESTRLHS